MIKVLKENPVPKSTVTCSNCKSELEYGNADLYIDYDAENKIYRYANASNHHHIYYFNCPVCGCKVNAPWIL